MASKANLKVKRLKRERQIKELILLQTSMFYLTLFLEKTGAIKNNTFVECKNSNLEDVKGAISLGKKIMGALKYVKMNMQNEALTIANNIIKQTDSETKFNYLIFVLILLMEYKENFKNKTYSISITYDELNTLYDEYLIIGIGDKEQMEAINDSAKVAEEYYLKVVNGDIKK